MKSYGKYIERGMPEKMRKRVFLFFCFRIICAVLILTFGANSVSRASNELPEEVGSLYAKSAVLMDAESGRVLLSKDGETMRPMASTTKIMTCILALEEGNMDDVVTTSGEAASQPKVHLGMSEGETFYLRDLLYSLMLESHNDSAVAIAEHLYGSVTAFAERMNEKALELGCEQTHFVTPNGLDGEDETGVHSISAANLARIMSYCVTKSPRTKEFLEITQTKEYSFTDVDGKRNFICTNHNLFLSMMDGAISGKTGFTGDAGYCYVGALHRDGKTLVVALLACGWPNNKNYKWVDTRTLMNYGLEHYEYRSLQEMSEVVKIQEIPVEDGIGEAGLFENAKVAVEIEGREEEFRVLLRDEEKIEARVESVEKLTAPVEKGQKVGTVSYCLGEEVLKEYALVATETVERKNYAWIFGKLFEIFHQFRIGTV